MTFIFSDNVKRILITGGAGFIGGALVRELLKNSNTKVFNLDKLTYASNLSEIEKIINKLEISTERYKFLKVDLIDLAATKAAIRLSDPDLVFHFAAESHVDKSIKNYRPFLETNVIGTINLLNASLLVGIEKFHFISTDEVYGSLDHKATVGFTERTQIDPKNPYSASKAAAEHYVKAWNNTYDLPYLITCSSNNYGIRQHHEKLIPKVVFNALNENKIYMYGGGHQTRDWLHVKDHCDAIWTLDKHGIINDKYNIGGNCEIQNIKLTKKILDIMNKSYKLIEKSYEDGLINYCRPGQDSRYATDFSKLTEKTRWEPKANLDKELENIVLWYIKKFQNTNSNDD